MITKKDKAYTELAYHLSKQSPGSRKFKLSAMIVFKGKNPIIGFNNSKTHPIQCCFTRKTDAQTMHAEVNAILNALREYYISDFKKATMYIGRCKLDIARNNSKGFARPCIGCMRLIREVGIKKICYTTDSDTVIGTMNYDEICQDVDINTDYVYDPSLFFGRNVNSLLLKGYEKN